MIRMHVYRNIIPHLCLRASKRTCQYSQHHKGFVLIYSVYYQVTRNGVDFVYLGRHYTVSIALPGSIIDNAQSTELKTYLAGQVNTVEHTSHTSISLHRLLELLSYLMWMKSLSLMNQFKGKYYFHVINSQMHLHNRKGLSSTQDCNLFLARVLQYLETPQ